MNIFLKKFLLNFTGMVIGITVIGFFVDVVFDGRDFGRWLKEIMGLQKVVIKFLVATALSLYFANKDLRKRKAKKGSLAE